MLQPWWSCDAPAGAGPRGADRLGPRLTASPFSSNCYPRRPWGFGGHPPGPPPPPRWLLESLPPLGRGQGEGSVVSVFARAANSLTASGRLAQDHVRWPRAAPDFRQSHRPPRLLTPLEYPDRFKVRYVGSHGGIRWNRRWVNVSTVWFGEYVGLEEIGDGIWTVYFGPLKLGRLLERHMRIEDQYGRLHRRTV